MQTGRNLKTPKRKHDGDIAPLRCHWNANILEECNSMVQHVHLGRPRVGWEIKNARLMELHNDTETR